MKGVLPGPNNLSSKEHHLIHEEKYLLQIWHPNAIINDGGSHFFNKLFKMCLEIYDARHNVSSPYHPQTTRQVEMSNREIKQILAKS